MYKITVKTLFGLEEILAEEIKALGYSNVNILNRAVQLEGDIKAVYELNFKLRTAISVLIEVKSFVLKDADDLYKKCKQIDWTSFFDIDKTFAVKGAVFSQLYTHTQYPYLVVKDAIADVFRDKVGDRPNVNLKSPQVLFDLYIKEKEVVISMNTSGAPLYQRGYRQMTGEAPLNEVLAAGMIQLSGWDKKSDFIDPFCGSGTLLIEAALMAADIPAMIEREHYAFKNFKNYNHEVWMDVYENVNRKPIRADFKIIGADNDATMIQKARRNSRSAPTGRMIDLVVSDFKELENVPEKGTIITNPPYGERIGEEIEELYTEFGNFMKQNLVGYNCWILSGNVDALKLVGLKPSKKIKLYNGKLECSFRKFEIYEGSKKVLSQDNIEDKKEVSTESTSKESKREKPKSVKPKSEEENKPENIEKSESSSKKTDKPEKKINVPTTKDKINKYKRRR